MWLTQPQLKRRKKLQSNAKDTLITAPNYKEAAGRNCRGPGVGVRSSGQSTGFLASGLDFYFKHGFQMSPRLLSMPLTLVLNKNLRAAPDYYKAVPKILYPGHRPTNNNNKN